MKQFLAKISRAGYNAKNLGHKRATVQYQIIQMLNDDRRYSKG